MKKILLPDSGELGREFAVSAQHKGQHVIACNSYAGAPAIQMADEFEVFDMLNGEELERVVKKHRPDIIVPEIEAIRTKRLYDFEKESVQVVPSARAVDFTMSRKTIRNLATQEPGLKTAEYFYTKTLEELKETADKIGFSCVVKPLMSSSDKGQSLVKNVGELEHAWEYGCSGSYGDVRELIIEEFIKFDNEITLLTVTQKSDPTLSCPPIGRTQKGGDYRESSQPTRTDPAYLKEAGEMVEKVTRVLTGAGLWGVEFFLSRDNKVYFSELSPRSHGTGVVTLTGMQNLNEFELHLCAVLGLPTPGIRQERIGANTVVPSPIASQEHLQYHRLEEVTREGDTYLHVLDKPFTRVNRRMGVVLCYAPLDSGLGALRDKAKRIAKEVEVH